ncbi:hypothetical protein N7489_002722 [Penicillium chrysogenum]|uniref:Uncharacterized protein n=1 Tax=Penicillium chrysogenum TaxID=5076 RepID=A0ABQ8WMJ4_PENCH|nr:uncharacterized protein N7489_002722 [Penicillium chrysogenum]KAJ5252312.1 hypothetical protein N7489_002722 [Penicillium chrysogenum]KAJ5271219.1 hypothetical protein N7505_006977 [Penicillium chrysogenum]
MATSVALGIGGWRLRKMWDSYDRNGPKEERVYCHTGRGTSYATLTYPFTVLYGLRNGVITFERRAVPVDNTQPNTRSYPQPGDPPVHRPPVPLAPRILRATSPVLPLLVPTGEAAPSTALFQELKMKVSATNDSSVAPYTFLCDH